MGFLSNALLFLSSTCFIAPIFAQETYDYIVVGSGNLDSTSHSKPRINSFAGPGGGPLASNLARANYTVLLIEAGDQSLQNSEEYPPQLTWDFFVKHYADEKRNMLNKHLTWKTKEGRYWVGAGSDTPPEGSTFLGVYYPRGSSVGGSSMINKQCT
jgi:choline dehydrogenase